MQNEIAFAGLVAIWALSGVSVQAAPASPGAMTQTNLMAPLRRCSTTTTALHGDTAIGAGRGCPDRIIHGGDTAMGIIGPGVQVLAQPLVLVKAKAFEKGFAPPLSGAFLSLNHACFYHINTCSIQISNSSEVTRFSPELKSFILLVKPTWIRTPLLDIDAPAGN